MLARLVSALALTLTVVGSANAQVIGVFRWQLQPYCNVVTLRVEQKGTLFELVGTDDQCGSGVLAAANGSAHVNPNGTVGIALTVVRPNGFTVSSSATVNLATISGTWADEYANSGLFVFNPASPATGLPRPITLTGFFAVAFPTTSGGQAGETAISFGKTLPSPPAVPPANVIPAAGPPTANCPGTLASPQALPGHLCLYERARDNVLGLSVFNANGESDQASVSGAGVFVASNTSGSVQWYGRWAVTIP